LCRLRRDCVRWIPHYYVGNNRNDQRNDAPTSAGFVAIACGGDHSVALRSDGTVVTWGSNIYTYGQRNDAPTSVGFVEIATTTASHFATTEA